MVPVLLFGTATFAAGSDAGLSTWGDTQVDEATRLVDVALDHGVNFFDTADTYSSGRSEEVLARPSQGDATAS